MIYLDYNSSTPILEDLKNEIPLLLQYYSNPSSEHSASKEVKERIEKSRLGILEALGLLNYKLVFCSTGTEANHLALQFLWEENPEERNGVIFSYSDHSSIMQLRESLKNFGYTVRILPSTRDGSIDLDYLEKYCSESTALVSIQLANPYTGLVQDLKQAREITDLYGTYLHTDSIQYISKTKNLLKEIDADSYTISGAKNYSIRGTSCLIYRSKPYSIFRGANQEKGLRAGSEFTLGIISLTKVLKFLTENEMEILNKQNELKEFLEFGLEKLGFEILFKNRNTLTNTISCLSKSKIDLLLKYLNEKEIYLSSKICSTDLEDKNRVFASIGYKKEEIERIMTFSFGIYSDKKELEYFLNSLKEFR